MPFIPLSDTLEPVPSIYGLKPRFQNSLRPLVRALARAGVTANQVTLSACVLSIALGILLVIFRDRTRLMLILPAFFFVRMALNAIDGMLAREFGQKSDLGAYLNELTDVVSDACLYLPFAYLPVFEPILIGVIIVLAVMSEMAGTVGVMIGATRRYDGPMGKSDRAFVFGAIALWIGLGGTIPAPVGWALPGLVTILLAATILNRVRGGLMEEKRARSTTMRAS
jgi:CDP-diacylglycerol--glycerol-3-phosphate 3-phosphatidyltransferase